MVSLPNVHLQRMPVYPYSFDLHDVLMTVFLQHLSSCGVLSKRVGDTDSSWFIFESWHLLLCLRRTYLVSAPIIPYYYTQLIGDAKNRPTLLAAPKFDGMAVIGTRWLISWNYPLTLTAQTPTHIFLAEAVPNIFRPQITCSSNSYLLFIFLFFGSSHRSIRNFVIDTRQ